MNFDDWILVCNFLNINELFQLRRVCNFMKSVSDFIINNDFKIRIPSDKMMQINFRCLFNRSNLPTWSNERVLICDSSIKIHQLSEFADRIMNRIFQEEVFHRNWRFKCFRFVNICLLLNKSDLSMSIHDLPNNNLYLEELNDVVEESPSTKLNQFEHKKRHKNKLQFIQLENLSLNVEKFLVFKKFKPTCALVSINKDW